MFISKQLSKVIFPPMQAPRLARDQVSIYVPAPGITHRLSPVIAPATGLSPVVVLGHNGSWPASKLATRTGMYRQLTGAYVSLNETGLGPLH